MKITKMIILWLVFLIGKIVVAQDSRGTRQDDRDDFDTLYENHAYSVGARRFEVRLSSESRHVTLTPNPTSGEGQRKNFAVIEQVFTLFDPSVTTDSLPQIIRFLHTMTTEEAWDVVHRTNALQFTFGIPNNMAVEIMTAVKNGELRADNIAISIIPRQKSTRPIRNDLTTEIVEDLSKSLIIEEDCEIVRGVRAKL